MLPPELWLAVFVAGRFSIKQAIRVRNVCRQWRNICRHLILEGSHSSDRALLKRFPQLGGINDVPGDPMFAGLRELEAFSTGTLRWKPYGVNAATLHSLDLWYVEPPDGRRWTTAHICRIMAACTSLKTLSLQGMQIGLDPIEPVRLPQSLRSMKLSCSSEMGSFTWPLHLWRYSSLRMLCLIRWVGTSAEWVTLVRNLPDLQRIVVCQCFYFDGPACDALLASCPALSHVTVADSWGSMPLRSLYHGAGTLQHLRLLRLENLSTPDVIPIRVTDLLWSGPGGPEYFPALEQLDIRCCCARF